MRNESATQQNRKRAERYSFSGDSSVESGFVINPENSSISIITDDFEPSISSETTGDTPMGNIIGRFNMFKKPKAPSSKGDSRVSYAPSSSDGDVFADNPLGVDSDKDELAEVSIDLGAPIFRPRPGKAPDTRAVEDEWGQWEDLGIQTALDFTKDEPSEMTFGRRIALSLMSRSWYNPRVNVAPPLKGGNLDDTNGVVENSNAAIEVQNKPIVGPSLERAWGYFEHVTLPRYISSNKRKGCCDRAGLLSANLEKANSGEQYLKSKLYDPIFTPLNQMGDFGLGFGLYFATLRVLMIVMFCAGLVSIPNLIYFSGSDYSDGQEGVHWALKGSAVCTNVTYVPCVDCTKDMFDGDRFQLMKHAVEGFELPFALKNNCEGSILSTGLFNLASSIVIILGLILSSYSLRNREVEFDEDQQTAQDYSIKVLNPPPDAKDPNEWKSFFRQKFGVKVAVCTITTDNQDLILKLVHRRELLLKVERIVGPFESLTNEKMERLAKNVSEGRNFFTSVLAKAFPGVPELFQQIQECEKTIRDLSWVDRNVTSVFITFETEAAQRKILSIMKTEDGIDPKYCFQGEFLNVLEPAEPSSIRWIDLDDSLKSTMVRYIATTFLTIGLIVGGAYFVREMRNYGASHAAFTISILNSIFPTLAKTLTNVEVHRNEGSKQTSLYMKVCCFRWVNTAIVTMLITPFTSTIMNGDEFLLAGVYAIFFAEIITTTALQLLDISGNLKRHYFAPRAVTQEEMNSCMKGSKVELAERYSNMTKLVFLALWYSPVYPGSLFLCSFALLLNFYLDRFSLMRSWAPAPRLSSVISRINRSYFLPVAIGIMAVVSSYTWTQFSFDNLCPTDSLPESYFGMWKMSAFGSDEIVGSYLDSRSASYKYCDQNLLSFGSAITFPALPLFQPSDAKWMNVEQESVALVWGWACVVILCFLGVYYLMAFLDHLTTAYEPRGKATDIPFSDVVSTHQGIGYIPQVISPMYSYPLVTCPVSLVHEDLFGWDSPYQEHIYFDLTLDAEKIMKEDKNGRSVSDSAFHRLVHWIH